MKPPNKKTKRRRPNEDLRISSSKNLQLIEIKHQQIVDGACRVFFEKGYHPTTIRMIAKACGMSMGQLYHYIHSKDDVLYLVHKHMQRVWYDYIKKSDMEKIEDPSEKMTEALRYTLKFMNENRKLIQFIYTESKYLDRKHLHVVLEMAYNNVIGFWRSLLTEVNKRESVKGDIDFLASLIAFLLVFLPLRGWTLTGKAKRESTDSLVDFVLGGLGILR